MEAQLIENIKNICKYDQQHIGDDCAVIELAGEKYLFSIDNFTEGTHFTSDIFSPEDIGWKSLAVNISDIAAMAGEPLYVLIGLALSKQIPDKEDWVARFYQGLNDCAAQFDSPQVIGGDISKAEHETSISIAIVGKAYRGQDLLLRSGAKPGDKVCVTGKFGNAAQYLSSSRTGPDEDIMLRPRPRLSESHKIWQHNTRGALMDSSDGLAQALIEIAEQSQVAIQINTDLTPKDCHIDLDTALYGGEDYELVACLETVPDGFTEIGKVSSLDCFSTNVLRNDGGGFAVTQNDEILRKDKIYKHF